MRRPLVVLVTALSVVVLGATAAVTATVATAGHDDRDAGVGPTTGTGMPGGAPTSSDEDESHRWGAGQMWDGTGDEASYLVEMIPHHREAIAAARQLERSARPQLRELGRAIVASQTAQVEQMEAWLAAWYPDRTRDTDYRPMMRDLSGLSGDRLDWAFLQDMVVHHMAAVMASQHLLVRDHVEHPEIARLARTIRDDQREEILQMRRWLVDWFGPDADPGAAMGPGMGPGMMW